MRIWPVAQFAALSALIVGTTFAQEPNPSRLCGAIYVSEQPYAAELAAATDALSEGIEDAAEVIAGEENLGRVWAFEDGSTEMLSETRNALAERWRHQMNAIMA